jgi:TetR/AcrR family transcriptional repressor of nem operon
MELLNMADTREIIMATARPVVQAHGYGGLSFRELAKAIGVKSASIHYHFPTKGDLGAALAQSYAREAQAQLQALWAQEQDPVACLRHYVAIFRKALENDNRMCLCGFMAAEYQDLPDAVKAEVAHFADINTAWLTMILTAQGDTAEAAQQRALAIFAAIGGAQLAARSRADIGIFDSVVESYRRFGLILSA